MRTCKQCSEVIPNWSEVNGKKVNLSSRYYCLVCSPYGSRIKNRSGNRSDSKKGLICKGCPSCGKTLPLDAFYVRKERIGGHHRSSWCRSCLNSEAVERFRRFKIKCVEYKGGSCISCGYNRYIGALDFHHRDPNEKDFHLSAARSHAWTPEIEQELDKCDLLCSNCHREVHGGFVPVA